MCPQVSKGWEPLVHRNQLINYFVRSLVNELFSVSVHCLVSLTSHMMFYRSSFPDSSRSKANCSIIPVPATEHGYLVVS
jgi:hypothetical protein